MRAREFANSKLVIFDIDDTLVNTDTKVNVVRDGKIVKQLNSHDFTHYHLQPGEEFDFGAFRDAREFYTQARPIPGMIRQLKQDIATGNKVIMLTARSDFNDREVFLDTFRQYGIDMSKVHVYRAGNLNIKAATEQKKKIILKHLLGKEHYDKVIMYDDSVPNLNAFLSLKQDYPWSKFYAWHVDPSGQADEYHRTDIKITEVNAPGELSVDEDLVKKFTDRGYQMDGEGSDQLVLSRPGSRMVLKIVGAGSEPRKNIIRRYVNFFRQHQRNPHFPRVGPDKELRWEGQRYYMYSQERLHDFEGGDDGEIRDYLEQLLALSWVRHTLKDQPPDLGELPQGLSEDQVKGLLAAVTLLYQSGIAGQYGYDLGNSYNIMQRASDNTLVIVDPFSDPEVEDLDEDLFHGIDISMERDDDEIMVRASAGGKQLGSVLFVEYDGYLMPQDLEVDERFRGQGIARAMYDYVKSRGYRIRRSGQQTDAGRGFWGKHRPDDNVWEDQEQYLYHATYRPLLKSIRDKGLGNSTQSHWSDSKPGVIYLARDPEVARSYAETAESVPDDWLDQIIIFKINSNKLDKSRLFMDQNVQDNEGDTLEYHGIIPVSDLRLTEHFADGKVKGKSRPGRVKRAGASCKGSVTSLRAKAKKSSGERGKMYHWCANMKSGRKKANESTDDPMLALDPWTFDQSDQGWRTLPMSRAIAAIKDYLGRYVRQGQFVNAPQGNKRLNPSTLYWHLGQLLAMSGDYDQAVSAMRSSLGTDADWNDYVRATIAFLANNKRQFDQYVGRDNSNKATIDRLSTNWGRPYKDAY